MDPSILSLLPPLVAIVLAIVTKQVMISLFIGVWVGATMCASFNPIVGLYDTFSNYVFEQMGDSWNASVIFMVFFCGSFALLIEKNGGAQAFAKGLTSKVKTQKGGQLATTLAGTAIFFSDSSSPVLVGPIFKPVTDALNISREKLAYIVDATTATMPSMFPFTAWGAYIISIMVKEFDSVGYEGNPVGEFVLAVPFSFYTICCVLMVYVIVLTGFDFGPMRKAEVRARTTGKVIADEDATPMLLRTVEIPAHANPTKWNMFTPLIVLLCTIFGGILWSGGWPGVGVLEALGNASVMKCLVVGFFVGSVVCAFVTVKSKVMTGLEAISNYFEGMRMMMDIAIILVLAWSIGSVCKSVGTTAYVIEITQGFITPAMMYAVIFIVAAFTAFSTGTSWGTFAIYLPISIPLALAIGAPLSPAIGIVLSGGIFGDHCSPISDTTILSCMGSSCPFVAHVKTQFPYAILVAGSAAVAYVVTGVFYESLGRGAVSVLGLVMTIGIAALMAAILHKMEVAREK